MADETHPACIHCGRPIKRTIFAHWWDIGEVAGWVCDASIRGDAVQTYRKIRQRLRKGLIDLTGHVAPPKREPIDMGEIF